ncbi:MAG: VOC family protein, partial [Bacteroidota bacterium]
MITQIDHIGIAVTDIEASMQMYSKIFGVESFHR